MDNDINYDFFYQQTGHELVQKYFSMRTLAYIDKWGLKQFSGEEDEYDINSHMLIIHKHGQCLGGARLVVHNIGDEFLLPLETDKFRVMDLFPQLELHKNKYAELSRVALAPELRTGEYSTQIYKKIGEKGKFLGIRYVFAIAPLLQARMSRMACKSVGLHIKDYPQIKILPLNTYEKNKLRFSIVDLHRTYEPQKTFDKTC